MQYILVDIAEREHFYPGKYISFINYKIWFTDTSDSIELKK